MKLGFIYAGQGTQYVGMGQSFYENDEDCKDLLDNVKLDFDLKDIMFNSEEKTISTTRFTQPAMVAVANMATLLLKKNGITPDYVCGLSLGEYSALSASGVFDPETAIQVVRERGLAMEKAAEGVESAMMAILGLEREPLLDICAGCDGYVSIANYNCPGQLVIAGEKKAVEEAIENADSNKSNEARIAIYISKEIPVGFITNKSAKDIISKAYQLYGIKKTGKATDLDNWFNCKAVSKRIDNKVVRGYEIYSSKLIYNDRGNN